MGSATLTPPYRFVSYSFTLELRRPDCVFDRAELGEEERLQDPVWPPVITPKRVDSDIRRACWRRRRGSANPAPSASTMRRIGSSIDNGSRPHCPEEAAALQGSWRPMNAEVEQRGIARSSIEPCAGHIRKDSTVKRNRVDRSQRLRERSGLRSIEPFAGHERYSPKLTHRRP